ncbi:unnamed protein product [Arctia plantaginis]|uniref:CCHC-type domain-containing protein n=1 Tax=Arctia plantaginis TaxID=874455 RepID=A0A8S0YXJ2_ARCPL|nr:unnamed protein product [Arctia plantaginis]
MGLPESYNTVITAIETISEKVTLDFVKTRLLDEELKKVTSNTEEPETIFTANVECYRCLKKGHIARNCKKNNFRGRRMRGRATGHSANYVTNDKWSVIAINNELECNLADLNNTIKFIIDSGATENIIKEEYENCMHNIKELDHTINIKMANGNIMEAKKSGEITIKSQGIKMNIQCIIVPGIAHNLLSVNKMSQKGLQVLFSKYVDETSSVLFATITLNWGWPRVERAITSSGRVIALVQAIADGVGFEIVDDNETSCACINDVGPLHVLPWLILLIDDNSESTAGSINLLFHSNHYLLYPQFFERKECDVGSKM